jgi:hypothetical protein
MTWTEWNQSKAAYQDPREGLRRDTEQEPVRIDTSGPTWTSGSAAPSSTPAYGSMYSRTAGGIGLTNLYVYTVAGWVGTA